jgi:MFS superfamily sulfate permease-like transporter
MSAVTEPQPRARGGVLPATFSRDFIASIVVFLVAMPLCMGIAIASGVPAERGLVTGIIGGIVAGALAGSPLQVSGPAAGLAVIVFEVVQKHGLSALGPILMLAGVVQLAAGALRLGQWFRAISPAVVHGMLAGIGVLIVVGQAHVLIDAKPLHSGVENLMAIPGAFFSLSPFTLGQAEAAFAVGAATILSIFLWEKFRPRALKLLPGALLGVIVGTAIAMAFGLDVKRIEVPESIVAALAVPAPADFGLLASPTIILTAVAIAFIASAETLLSAAAVDRMHDGVRTKYNKELFAQGVGNTLCGLVGALPMTGVIVRSSANVQAGAASRASTMMHGFWILGAVALLPFVLRQIPMASLAGILVVTGWKLVSLKHVRHLFHRYGLLPTLVWAATFAMVIATDLLMGVLTGLALSLLELVPHLRRLKLGIRQRSDAEEHELELSGSATFVQLPRLSTVLDAVPEGKPVKLHLAGLDHVDHTVSELVSDWIERRRASGARVVIPPACAEKHPRFAAAAAA